MVRKVFFSTGLILLTGVSFLPEIGTPVSWAYPPETKTSQQALSGIPEGDSEIELEEQLIGDRKTPDSRTGLILNSDLPAQLELDDSSQNDMVFYETSWFSKKKKKKSDPLLKIWKADPRKRKILARLAEALGWQYRSWVPFSLPEKIRSRIQVNRSEERSLYAGESEIHLSMDEALMLNIEKFKKDPQYSCRRPFAARWIAALLDQNYSQKACDQVNFLIPLWNEDAYSSDDTSPFRVVSIDPSKVYDVEYLEAGPGEEIYQKKGHAMYRIVVCAPDRKVVDEHCLEDTGYHLVATFAANPLERVSDLAIGSALDGINSNLRGRLFLNTFPSSVREYSLIEDRPLRTVSCQLNEDKKVEFLELIQQWHTEMVFGYHLLKNNCATGAYSLGRCVLNPFDSSHPFASAPTFKTPAGLRKAFDRLCSPKKDSSQTIQESRSSLLRKQIREMEGFFETIEASLSQETFDRRTQEKYQNFDKEVLKTEEEMKALDGQIFENQREILSPLLDRAEQELKAPKPRVKAYFENAGKVSDSDPEERKRSLISLAEQEFDFRIDSEVLLEMAETYCFFHNESLQCQVFRNRKETDLKYKKLEQSQFAVKEVAGKVHTEFHSAYQLFRIDLKSLLKALQKSTTWPTSLKNSPSEVLTKKFDSAKRKAMFRDFYPSFLKYRDFLSTQKDREFASKESQELSQNLEKARLQLISFFDTLEIYVVGDTLKTRLDKVKDLATSGSGLKSQWWSREVSEKKKFTMTQDLMKESLKKIGLATLESDRVHLEQHLRKVGYYEEAAKKGISYFADLMVIFYKQAAMLPREFMPSWRLSYGIPTKNEMNQLLNELDTSEEAQDRKRSATYLEEELKSYLSNPAYVTAEFLKEMKECDENSQAAIFNRLFYFSCLIHWGDQCLKYDDLPENHPEKTKVLKELAELWSNPGKAFQGLSGFTGTNIKKDGNFVLFDLYRWERR